ncbi:TIGR03943 family protein [Microbacterium sp.]|uniref:TIGR03943 family putative permease subunit n=1 Tax=unclassified Microbacterium TaxID=2609290 RepID=UPI0026210CFA|nr:TIGR03943 family protein [Microbacterium sp.]
MPRLGSLGTRWLGVGLASALAVLTVGLAVTGRLSLYINPESAWFAVGMSVIVLVGAVASFALPLGAENDHGHDHGEASAHEHDHAHIRHPVALAGTVVAGVLASAVVIGALALPPSSLSPQFASTSTSTTPVLFGGRDVVTLASTGDTATFGVGEWATVFATATDPASFDGDAVTLTGFVAPGDAGTGFLLSRFVITHCVIDAQLAAVPIAWGGTAAPEGEWATVTGTVRSDSDGRLHIAAESVEAVPEPEDPYEY